jgi:YD repeat-containing protein
MRKRLCCWITVLLIVSFFLSPPLGQGTENYFYDDLGRLSRVIAQDGAVATYRYDAVGNLLGIFKTTGETGAPTIDEISPPSVSAGTTHRVILKGTRLEGAFLAIDNPEIHILGVRSQTDSVTADILIPNPTRFGSTSLTITTRTGSSSGNLQVNPPELVLSRLSPNKGLPWDEIVIEGFGFGTDSTKTDVQFAGEMGPLHVTPRSFPQPSATRLVVVVPDGVIPGDIVLTVGSQTSNPLPFKVPIRLSLDTPIVGVGQTAKLTAILPADVVGTSSLLLTLSSDNQAVATIQTPVSILAGTRIATATVVGVDNRPKPAPISSFSASGSSSGGGGGGGASISPPAGSVVVAPIIIGGTANLTASASGFEAGNILIQVDTRTLSLPEYVTTSPSRSVSVPVILSEKAPPGGLRIVLTSDSPAVATFDSLLLIPEGETSRNVKVTGVNLGSVRIRAAAPSYASAETYISVDLTPSFSPHTTGLPPGFSGRAKIRLSAPAPPGGLTFKLDSTNSSIAFSDPAEVIIPAGQTSANFSVKAVSLGYAQIYALHPKLLTPSMTILVRADFSVSPKILQIRNNLPTYIVQINMGCQQGYSLSLLDPAPIGGVKVNLAVTDPAIATISPAEIDFVEGETSKPFTILGLHFGETTLTISAPGFPTKNQPIVVPEPKITLAPINVQSPLYTILSPIFSRIGLQNTDSCQQGLENDLSVSLTSSDSNVLSLPPSAMIKANTLGTSTMITVVGEGQAQITASASGFTSVQSNVVTVTKPRISGPSSFMLGKGMKGSIQISLSVSPPAGATLSLTSSNPDVLRFDSSDSIAIPHMIFQTSITLIGQNEGTTTLTVSAPGFFTATIPITIVRPALEFHLLPSDRLSTLSPPANYSLKVSPPEQLPVQPIQVSIVSSDPSVLPITSPLTLSGEYIVSKVVPMAAGLATLTASAPGFDSATSNTISITQPWIDIMAKNVTIGKGLKINSDNPVSTPPVRVVLSDPAPQEGATVTLSNSNPAVATISPETILFAPGEKEKKLGDIDAKNIGTATITASAPGWVADTNTISVVIPVLIPRAPTVDFRTVSIPQPFQLFTSTGFRTIDPPKGEMWIAVTSSDPSVIRVDPAGFIPAGVNGSTPIFMTPVGPGSAIISFSAPNFHPGSFSVTVTIPKLTLSPSELFARPGTNNNLTLSLQDPAPPGGLIVELESSAPDIVPIPVSILIPPFATSVTIPIVTALEGSVVITAIATGFIGTQAEVIVEPIILTGLIATAPIGTPADRSLPSVNGGQSVSITGGNFRPSDHVLVPVSGPDGTTEVEVLISHISQNRAQASFSTPFNAVTGLIRVNGGADSFPLQIVPVIRDGKGLFKPEGEYTLFGSGFGEGHVRIMIGQSEVIGTSTIDKLGSLTTFLLPEEAGSTIQIRTEGGESNLFDAGPFSLNAIKAIAESGQPADPSLPSANAGQWINIKGSNLRSNYFLLVPNEASQSRVAVPLGTSYYPTDTAAISLPLNTIGGPVKLYGAPEEIRLQIVPRLYGASGSLIAGSRLNIAGNSFVVGQTEVLLGEIVVPASQVSVESATQLSLTMPDSFGSPLRVRTADGVSNILPLPLSGGIMSAANLGLPIDPAIPSANIGQTITMILENLTSHIHAEFSGRNNDGASITINVPVGNVSADGLFLSVVVPMGAVTGQVRLIKTRTEGDLIISTHFLQIVPKLSGATGRLSAGSRLNLTGDGFVTGETEVLFEETLVLASDVTVQSPTKLSFTLPTFFGPFIRVKGSGGISNLFALPLFEGIISVATLGQPADPSAPSANVGQTITMIGENLTRNVDTEFSGRNNDGAPITINGWASNISADGRFLSVVVPTGAVTGQVRLIVPRPEGDLILSTHFLQIVPYAQEVRLPPSDLFTSGTGSVIVGSGFVVGETSIVIQDSRLPALSVVENGSLLIFMPVAAVPEGTPITLETTGGKSNAVFPTFLIPEVESNDSFGLANPIALIPDVESNDSFGLANPIALTHFEGSKFGRISPRGDIDFYRFILPQSNFGFGFRINIQSRFFPSVNHFEGRLKIYNSSGELLHQVSFPSDALDPHHLQANLSVDNSDPLFVSVESLSAERGDDIPYFLSISVQEIIPQ